MTCNVYVIEAGGRVKIGLSDDPRKRLGELATGSAYAPTLIHSWRVASRADALTMERAMHGVFRRQRMNGEWFDVPADEVVGVGERLVQGDREGAAKRLRAYRQHGKFRDAWMRRCEGRASARRVERSWRVLKLSTARLNDAGMLFNPWDLEAA